MTEINSNRIVYFDLLRVLSVFSMMMLHVAASEMYSVPVSSLAWQVFNVYDSLVRFCVPVFFMISGVFLLDNERPFTIQKLFSKNILRIVTAFIFWSFIYTVFIDLPKDQFSVGAFLILFLRGHFHLWFLFAIVGLYLITPCLRKITIDLNLEGYFVILFFIFCIFINALKFIPSVTTLISQVMANTNLNFVTGYVGYYVLGNFLYRVELKKPLRLIIYLLGILSIVFTIVVTSVFSVSAEVFNEYWYAYLLPNTAFTSIAIFVFFKYNISKIQWTTSQTKAILLFSRLSFGMYLAHDLINFLLSQLGITTISYNPIISVPINTMIVFSMSFLITWVISKFKILGKYAI